LSLQRFRSVVTSAEELRKLIGEPGELVIRKQLSELDAYMTTFISESPFLLLGTVGRDGTCDVSPRGDAHGLAQVLDSRTIVIPDRRGNRRVDSLRNILETGRVGILFMIPGLGETLRVNGRACVIRDEEVLAPLAAEGKVPIVGIAVGVEECFLQCAKAVIRSKLWERDARGRETSLPSFARILIDETKIEGETVESLNQRIEDSYTNNLY
jgi:PPOX class probable FMN-dependent enzyme